MKTSRYIGPTLALWTAALVSCGENDAIRERDLAHARRLAEIEVETAEKLARLRLEHQEGERRQARAAQEAETNRQQQQKFALIRNLTFTTRKSLLDENTQVLQINNPNGQSVDIHLRCHAINGASRTLFVSVGAYKTSEIGVLEGWPFVSGESFEVISDGEIIHRYNIN